MLAERQSYPCETAAERTTFPAHVAIPTRERGVSMLMQHISRFIVLLGLVMSVLGPSSVGAQTVAPKAYIGLFKDDALAVLDTASNKIVKTIPIPPGPHGLVVTPDGRRVYASSDGDSKVSVVDTRSDEVVTSVEVGPTPHGLAITPDGSLVLVAGFGTNSVQAIDTRNNQVVWQVAAPQPHNIAITPDGKTAYVAAQQKDQWGLLQIDLSTGNSQGMLALDHTPRALNVSPDGLKLVYTLSGVDALQVLDV